MNESNKKVYQNKAGQTVRTINILLVEDEEFDVERVKNTLQLFEEKIRILDVVSNGKSACDLIQQNPDKYDIVILDYQISGGLRGEDLIRKMKEIDPVIQIIVVTKMTINITDYQFANNLMKSGAFWYCTKYPGNIEEYIYQPTDFVTGIFNAFEKRQLEKQNHKSNKRLMKSVEGQLENKKIIGTSKAVSLLKENIEKFGKSEVNILVYGSSGTGKELVAWNIHLKSKRRYENFVPINCGSIPQNLVESELFGYEKGAFTGANVGKQGLFEVANNGTIFLDEVSELPLSTQVKLLRVIQEGEIEKIGRTDKVSVNVRVIAATNKNLASLVNSGEFREDLYYRLSVVLIDIPPLKDRDNDVLELFDYFLEYFCHDLGIDVPVVEEEARQILANYKWPGNVRELRNVVQRLLLISDGLITAKTVSNPMILRNHGILVDVTSFDDLLNGQVVPLKDLEKIIRTKYFKYVRGISTSDANAAEKLGLAPSNFHRMCRELGLKQ